MEHKIVLGGEQFLPFARSRIRALRALGLPYADQSFEIDGVSIKVRIEPGHEYIRLEGSSAAYMESGQLEFTFPGDLNPDRLKPAKWHFLDIPTTAKYLGNIVASGKNIGDQKNSPDLSESMDSLAIGYPKAPAEDPDKVAKDAASEIEYSAATVMKKMVVATFPSSLFSGKMRLFMQAQYGAAINLKRQPFFIDLVGTQRVLIYMDAKGNELQFGFWSHHDQGIYRAPLPPEDDGSYWFIDIRNPTTAKYFIYAYRIGLSPGVSGLLGKIRKPETTEEDRLKCEAYIFANATIDLTSKKEIHSFDDVSGDPMAYGWKFNADGSRISMVANKLVGTDYLDNKYYASTIHIDIRSQKNDETNDRDFSVSVTKSEPTPWQDGWGEFNIFVPGDDSNYLQHYSSMSYRAGSAPAFSFAPIEVYGYYKDNEWVSVKISKDVSTSSVFHETCSMDYPDPGYNIASRARYQFDAILATDNWNYDSSLVSSSVTMDLSIGGMVYAGISEYGQHTKIEHTCSAPVNGGPGSMANYISSQVGSTSGLFFHAPDHYGDPDGYAAWIAAPPSTPSESSHFFGGFSEWHTETWVYTGWKSHKWTLVIPCNDCEAVFAATHENDQPEGLGTHDIHINPSVLTVQNHDYGYSVVPYTGYANYSISDTVITNNDPPPASTAEIYCFNQAIDGLQGEFHASSVPLFEVDTDHPYYNANMTSHTSAGKRYIVSEGLKDPASVNDWHRFVGWA